MQLLSDTHGHSIVQTVHLHHSSEGTVMPRPGGLNRPDLKHSALALTLTKPYSFKPAKDSHTLPGEVTTRLPSTCITGDIIPRTHVLETPAVLGCS